MRRRQCFNGVESKAVGPRAFGFAQTRRRIVESRVMIGRMIRKEAELGTYSINLCLAWTHEGRHVGVPLAPPSSVCQEDKDGRPAGIKRRQLDSTNAAALKR